MSPLEGESISANWTTMCLFGFVKVGDLDWFMIQKQRLHYSQQQKKTICFLTLCAVAQSHVMLPALLGLQDRACSLTLFFTVWRRLQTHEICLLESDSARKPLCLQKKIWNTFKFEWSLTSDERCVTPSKKNKQKKVHNSRCICILHLDQWWPHILNIHKQKHTHTTLRKLLSAT